MTHDPFDKSRCSFPVPEFESEDEERQWFWLLSPDQGLEIVRLMNLARYGEEACNRPMDKTCIRVLTMEEARAEDEAEEEADERWRAEHGWPSRRPKNQSVV